MITLREKRARTIALLTGVMVIFMAVLFAALQNRPANTAGNNTYEVPDTVTNISTPDAEILAIGRGVFEAQACMRCHAIAGEGNRRNPLDGIGERRSADAIRQWILAPVELQGQLSTWAFRAKQAYRDLPAADLDALVMYLQSLPAQPPAN